MFNNEQQCFAAIIVIFISQKNFIYCTTSNDRIVFPDETAEWNKYNAIQAQQQAAEPVFRKQNTIPTTKDYDFVTQFTINLFKESKPNIPTENLVLCPILVALLLSHLQSAAVDQTKNELTKLIGNLDPYIIDRLINDLSITSHRNELNLATAVLAGEAISLNRTFIDNGNSRNVDVMNVDFNHPMIAATKANKWIATKTKNNIRNAIDPNTLNGIRLMLMNVLYFRGYWRYPFNETTKEQFHLTPYHSKLITFMKQNSKLRANDKTKTKSGAVSFTWIELPYEGNGYCLVVLLPNDRHRLDDLIQHLSAQDFIALMEQLDEPYKRQVALKMPRFIARTTYSLVPTLQKLGLQNIFTGESQLPYLTTNNERLVVGDIMQQSLLNVDEIGTVATSATNLGVIALSIAPNLQKLTVNIDQPFLVTIFDKRNQMPLFIGKINDP